MEYEYKSLIESTEYLCTNILELQVDLDTLERLKNIRFDIVYTLSLRLEHYYIEATKDLLESTDIYIAYILIGSISEFWLQTFYTIYHKDYLSDESRKLLKPCSDEKFDVSKIPLDRLIQFSENNLLEEDRELIPELRIIQSNRNLVHFFDKEFLLKSSNIIKGIDALTKILNHIEMRLPPSINDF